jgi:CRISPR-associated endonuclease/helicase Cas3
VTRKYYAHSLPGRPPEEWQPLEEHLKNVAELAKSFAESFGAGDWAYLAGLWHDLGKYSDEFQKMLFEANDLDAHIETRPGKPDHSTAGAQYASNWHKDKGKILAYTIAGHHTGLPDGKTNENSCLAVRLHKNIPNYFFFPDWLHNITTPNFLPFKTDMKRIGLQLSCFIRMLYSCLVDADFLDTEAFMDKEKSLWRKGYPSLTVLNGRLTAALDRLLAKAPPTKINMHRAAILTNSLSAADLPQGLFSLTVPTGGGKTLSSLAFAMKHALKHNLKRIIYVIPYTSIIEQNAEVFREILGADAVLEHHSNYEPKEENYRSRLSAENWDAPVIVTTNVQFFESLYSCRSSQSRKLHNIAKSVVILDEAQMLPVPLLKPCIEILRELSSSYNTTIVLCTATQPALSTAETFKDGLDNVTEIIPNPAELYTVFKRIQTEPLSTLSDDMLAEKIKEHEQALCIVNTRKHARQIFEKLQGIEGCYHLSALMCPAHRTKVLNNIKTALAEEKTCRVISTQLVEAGVDVDFPVVFRSIAGIDSLAQAAGRCNREGRLAEHGKFYIFFPESRLPPGHFRQTAETADTVIRHHNDSLSLEAVEEYFKTLYWMKGEQLDTYHLMESLRAGVMKGDFPFREVHERFKIIKDGMESIIIPWDKNAERIIQGIRYSENPGAFTRPAQRYTVQVFPKVLSALLNVGSVECLHEQYYVLINKDLYRDNLGLCPEDPTFHEVESLIV